MTNQNTKICPRCHLPKSLTKDFHPRRCGTHVSGYCSACRNAYGKAWRKANPEKMKASHARARAMERERERKESMNDTD